jgi:Pyruvate/2-oxoacid:ferredoxin oxidoreductase gamma subunit
MSEEARKKLIGEADPERTLVVYDNTLVKGIPDNYKKTFAVPATGEAEAAFKNRMVANIYMLGATIEVINPGSFEVLKKIVSASVPKKFEELNIKALEAGHEYYQNHKPV